MYCYILLFNYRGRGEFLLNLVLKKINILFLKKEGLDVYLI